ncbi:DUF2059 domain-containing protein [Rhizobium sp. TH2]|uniref:DUF2059 domain-containing protein n=1 Tax=Rhizobium sp. TH2 TaxID=2775403 RepID=UPI0021588B11|nr:DUF2059 domain-containing protein [Rhizobium sp. TH2]UVC11479.1 DUF2059 domain-containing protein [Rhizobium sp. TH2]
MMKLSQLGKLTAAAIIVAAFGATAVRAADNVTPEQLKAARATIAAVGATTKFDVILPTIAEQLKQQLIQATPNFEPVINEVVDAKAIEFAKRRTDLENEAAKVYATSFTLEELNAITAFYTSPAGKKLIANGPIALREMNKAADIWATGVSRDLTKSASEAIEAKLAEADKTAPQQ